MTLLPSIMMDGLSAWGGGQSVPVITLPAPVLSITSGASVMTPTFSIVWPDTLVLGDVVTLQQANNAGFTGATTYTHTIDSTDIANGSFGWGNSRLVTGTHYFRVKNTRASIDVTSWSNTASIALTEANPVITSSAAINNLGNSVLAHSLTADIPVTWSIVSGVDAAQFEISGSTLRWLSNGTKNFSSPTDSGGNNVYDVTIRATNASGGTTNQAIAVTVQSPAPIANYLGGSVVGANQILTLSVAMPASGSGRLVVLTNIQNSSKDVATVVYDPTGDNVSLAQDVQDTTGNSFSIWSANISPAGGTKNIVITGVTSFEFQFSECTYAAWFLEGKSAAAATTIMTTSGPSSSLGSVLPGDFIVALLRTGSNHPDWVGSEQAPTGARALGTNVADTAEWSTLLTDSSLTLQPKSGVAYPRVMARFR